MIFEEWLEKSKYKVVLLLTDVEEILTVMKAAWQAGYDEGYEQGCEEVMAK